MLENNINDNHFSEWHKGSGINKQTIRKSKIYSINKNAAKRSGFTNSIKSGGYIIPYPYLLEEGIDHSYLRFKPDIPVNTDNGKPAKYLTKTGDISRIYRPVNLPVKILLDPTCSLIITEGEKKSVKATQEGFNTIALPGVWNWRSKQTKNGIITDLEKITWLNRKIYIIFDSDVVHKDEVKKARQELSKYLASKGALVFTVDLPDLANGNKCGLDDYLLNYSTTNFQQLIDEQARPYKGLITIPTINKAPITNKNYFEKVDDAQKERETFYINSPDKVIIDESNTGSGKTSTVKTLSKKYTPSTTRIVLVSQSPSNTYTDHRLSEYGFFLYEGRNERNCISYNICTKLLSNGYKDIQKTICTSCTNKEDCSFLKQRTKAVSRHIVIHPSSYFALMQKNDIVFIDEGTNLIPLTEVLEITSEDLQGVIKYIQDLQNLCTPTNRLTLDNLINLLNCLNETISNEVYFAKLERKRHKNELVNDEAIIMIKDLIDQASTLKAKEIARISKHLLTKNYEQIHKTINTDMGEIQPNFFDDLMEWLKKPQPGIIISPNKIKLFKENPFWHTLIESTKKVLVLDATPDNNLVNYFNFKNIEFKKCEFSIDKIVPEIIQIVNSTKTKTCSLINTRDKGLIKHLAKYREGSIGIICFKKDEQLIQDFLQESNLEKRFIVGHFGADNRGTNKFSNCNTLIVFGRYYPNINIKLAEAKTLGIPTELVNKTLPFIGEDKLIYKENHNEFIYNCFLKETLQAIGRISRGSSAEKKDIQLKLGQSLPQEPEVYLVTSEPINLPVKIKYYEDIMNFEEYATEKELKRHKKKQEKKQQTFTFLDKLYKNNKLISKRQLSKKAKCTHTTIKEWEENRKIQLSNSLHKNPTNASLPSYINTYRNIEEHLKPIINSISTYFDKKFVGFLHNNLEGILSKEIFTCKPNESTILSLLKGLQKLLSTKKNITANALSRLTTINTKTCKEFVDHFNLFLEKIDKIETFIEEDNPLNSLHSPQNNNNIHLSNLLKNNTLQNDIPVNRETKGINCM